MGSQWHEHEQEQHDRMHPGQRCRNCPAEREARERMGQPYIEPAWSVVLGRTLILLAVVFGILVFCRIIFQAVTGQ